MKILLYRPGSPTAFRLFDNPCEVIIPKGSKIVYIVNPGIELDGQSPIVAEYNLIRRPDPMWTDDTKVNTEVMVKLTVEDIED